MAQSLLPLAHPLPKVPDQQRIIPLRSMLRSIRDDKLRFEKVRLR